MMGDDKDWDGQARTAVAKAMDDYAKENPAYTPRMPGTPSAPSGL